MFSDKVINTTVSIASSYVILRRIDGVPHTNVPHLVTHHSPDGFEWGYGGSGPADLALNIVEDCLRRIGHTGPTVRMWQGECFKLAWELHQNFKWLYITTMPTNGGSIRYGLIEEWLVKNGGLQK